MPPPNTQRELAAMRQSLDDLRLSIERNPKREVSVEGSIKTRRRPSGRDIKFHASPIGVSRSYVKNDAEISAPYDLAEIIKLQDVESYVAISVDRHVELIMKNGWELTGKNPETVEWVRQRLKEASLLAGQPFSDQLREVIRNIVSVSNSYLVKSRDKTRSRGHRIRMWGKVRDPISFFSVPDPCTVRLRQTKSGMPRQYVQRLGGRTKKWPHYDVVHFTWRKKSGYRFGTPYVIPVLEDIRALRKLEMVCEHVAHKFAFPLMHWRVGTKEAPADMIIDPNSSTQVPEVDVANAYAASMAQEGYVVTSERHEISVVGAEGVALDLQPFIEHYELRVLAGLRLSMLDIGRGDTANRGTAKVLSQILADACKEIQDVVCSFMNEHLFDELVMEGDFRLTEENCVKLKFPAIDTEEERAQQNHGLQLFVQGGITREEFRRDYLHREDVSDEANLYLNEHLIPLARAQAKAKASFGPGGGPGNSAQPANQHGKASTKKKIAANDQVHQLWMRCSDHAVQLLREKKDLRVAFTQTFKAMNTTMRDGLISDWNEGFDAFFIGNPDAVKGFDVPREEDRDLDQVVHLATEARHKDLQQVQGMCMFQSGIHPRTGLAKDARLSHGLIVPAFRASEVVLEAKLDRVHRAARILGYMEGAKAAGRTAIDVTDRYGQQSAFTIPSSEESGSSIMRPLVLSDRLQSCAIGSLDVTNVKEEISS